MRKQFKSNNFSFLLLGSSNDLRTNKWRVTCNNCNTNHEPSTTMIAVSLIICPKCNEKETINYNELKELDYEDTSRRN